MVVTVNCYVTIIGVILATIWAQGSKRGKPHAGGRSNRRTTTMLGSLQFASRHVESQMPSVDEDEDEDEDEFEAGPPRGKQAKAAGAGMQRTLELGRGGEPQTAVSTPNEKSVFFQSVGGSTVITQGTVDEDSEVVPEEKRISESSSAESTSRGFITVPEPTPEPAPEPDHEHERPNTAIASEKSVYSAPASPTSASVRERQPSCCLDAADDPISFAV